MGFVLSSPDNIHEKWRKKKQKSGVLETNFDLLQSTFMVGKNDFDRHFGRGWQEAFTLEQTITSNSWSNQQSRARRTTAVKVWLSYFLLNCLEHFLWQNFHKCMLIEILLTNNKKWKSWFLSLNYILFYFDLSIKRHISY